MDNDNTKEQIRTLEKLCQQTHDYLNRVGSIKLGRIGLTSVRMMVLSILNQASEPVTIAMVAGGIAREQNTVTELLKRMEQDGLIKKVRQQGKPNLYTIELTKKGEEAYSRAVELHAHYKILASLTQEERGNLGVYLKKIRSKSLEELHQLINFPST